MKEKKTHSKFVLVHVGDNYDRWTHFVFVFIVASDDWSKRSICHQRFKKNCLQWRGIVKVVSFFLFRFNLVWQAIVRIVSISDEYRIYVINRPERCFVNRNAVAFKADGRWPDVDEMHLFFSHCLWQKGAGTTTTCCHILCVYLLP